MEDFVMDAGQSLMLMSLLSVILFCGCCHQFLRTLTKPVPLVNRGSFAKSALRVEKSYKVFAWGVLMAAFLVGLVISFAEVFARL